jgi:FkbM family methyltransferase
MKDALKQIIKTKSWWYTISDSAFYRKMRDAGRYELFQQETNFYRALVGDSNDLIFDVGANVGTKAKIFGLLAKQVVLFEPDHTNLKILGARLKNNERFIIHGCALGNEQGTSSYYSIGNDSAYNSLSEKHINNIARQRGIIKNERLLTQYEVETNTLDFFIDKYGLPGYIKIDVEGFEKQVIEGLSQPVNLISFEANLPEFLPESIDIVRYLAGLSGQKYRFNYAIDNSFGLSDFLADDAFIDKIKKLKVRSIEIYCRLDEIN